MLQFLTDYFHKKTHFFESFSLFFVSLFIFFMSMKITPGITPDSILKYLPMSDYIFQNGFLNFLFKGSYETTVMPPLYELVSAFFMITGFDSIHSAGIVSNISFALLPIPLYYLSKQIGGMKFAALSVLLCFVIKPFWDIGTAIMTDMLFIFLIFSSICFFSRFLKYAKTNDLLLSSLLLVLANWTRWLGISLLFTYVVILVIRYYQTRTNKRELLLFCVISFPLISLLFIRNHLLVGELYIIEKIPFSLVNIIINFGMAIITIVWDFIAFNPLNNFNQLLMNYYYTNYVNILPLDYLELFNSFNIAFPQFISLILGLLLIISLILILFFRFFDAINTFFKDFLAINLTLKLLLLFMFFYLGALLYTEGTTRLSLIDSRYLLPIYPIIIIGTIKGITLILNSTSHYRKISKVIILTCAIFFIIWQSMSTISYVSNVYSGRDFSDPKQMEGPAFQWMLENANDSSIYVINDRLRAFLWEKKLQISLIPMPNRDHPIQNYLNNLTSGTYLVITPVIGTKGPYRMVELERFLFNSTKYSLVFKDEQDWIFKVIAC